MEIVMNWRVVIIVGCLLVIVVALMFITVPNRCNTATMNDLNIEATKAMIVSADAIVSSVETIRFEKRAGMRKVRVRLTVEHKGEAAKEITIVEWVPVVLLGRLTEGSSVKLINDPVEGRVTFGL
jgi:hypothetical protein